MTYHVPSTTERRPGRKETKLSDGATLSPPDTGWDEPTARVCGFVPVVATARPADTDTTTHDRSLDVSGASMVDGVATGSARVVWTERAKTQAELDADAAQAVRTARDTFLTNAIATLETWSAQADSHVVTQGNAVSTVQTITDNLATFYDGFAKLLRNQYGVD